MIISPSILQSPPNCSFSDEEKHLNLWYHTTYIFHFIFREISEIIHFHFKGFIILFFPVINSHTYSSQSSFKALFTNYSPYSITVRYNVYIHFLAPTLYEFVHASPAGYVVLIHKAKFSGSQNPPASVCGRWHMFNALIWLSVCWGMRARMLERKKRKITVNVLGNILLIRGLLTLPLAVSLSLYILLVCYNVVSVL